MAALRDIIARGHGTAHAWRVESDGDTATLWHYSTPMLRWNLERPDDPGTLDFDLGWSSVSDQNGMNTAFRTLGLPYRYDRDARGGGPRITELRRHPCGCLTDARVKRCDCPAAESSRALEQLTTVGPAGGAELRALVYG